MLYQNGSFLVQQHKCYKAELKLWTSETSQRAFGARLIVLKVPAELKEYLVV